MTNPPSSGNDSSGWSSPGGWGTPSEPGYTDPNAPGQGQPGQQYPGEYPGQHYPGQQYGGGPAHPGYGPPQPPPQIAQQPGVIPLQPLSLGQIYDGAIKSIRANPVVMFLFAGILITISTVIELLLTSSMFESLMNSLDQLEDPETFDPGDLMQPVFDSVPKMLLGMGITFVITVILTGILTYAVSQAVLGFKPTPSQVWDAAKGRMLPLLGLTILISLLFVIPMVVVFGVVLVAATALDAALVALLGLVLALVMLAWVVALIPMTTLSTPALMLEGASPITAIRRGWRLSRPDFWRILGIYLLTMLLVMVIASVITAPLSIIAVALPPTGVLILQGISSALATVLVTPFTAAVATLLYIDARIRREGLAMELAAGAARPQ